MKHISLQIPYVVVCADIFVLTKFGLDESSNFRIDYTRAKRHIFDSQICSKFEKLSKSGTNGSYFFSTKIIDACTAIIRMALMDHLGKFRVLESGAILE